MSIKINNCFLDDSLNFFGLKWEFDQYVFTSQNDSDPSLITDISRIAKILQHYPISDANLKDFTFQRSIKIAKYFERVNSYISEYNAVLKQKRNTPLIRFLIKIPLINRVALWFFKDLSAPTEWTKKVLTRAVSARSSGFELNQKETNAFAQLISNLSISEIETKLTDLHDVEQFKPLLTNEDKIKAELSQENSSELYQRKNELLKLVEKFRSHYHSLDGILAQDVCKIAEQLIHQIYESRLMDLIPALKLASDILENYAIPFNSQDSWETARGKCNDCLKALNLKLTESDQKIVPPNLKKQWQEAVDKVKKAYTEWHFNRLTELFEGTPKIEEVLETDDEDLFLKKFDSLKNMLSGDPQFESALQKLEQFYERYLQQSFPVFAEASRTLASVATSLKKQDLQLVAVSSGQDETQSEEWYKSKLAIVETDETNNPKVDETIKKARAFLRLGLNHLYLKNVGESSVPPEGPDRGFVNELRFFFNVAPKVETIFKPYKEHIKKLLGVNATKEIESRYKEVHASLLENSSEELAERTKTLETAYANYRRSLWLAPLVAHVRSKKTLGFDALFPSFSVEDPLRALDERRKFLLKELDEQEAILPKGNEKLHAAIINLLNQVRESIHKEWEKLLSQRLPFYQEIQRILLGIQGNPDHLWRKMGYDIKTTSDNLATHQLLLERFQTEEESLPQEIKDKLAIVCEAINLAYKEWEADRLIGMEKKYGSTYGLSDEDRPRTKIERYSLILGVAENQRVKRYRELQKLLHPDKNSGLPELYLAKILRAGKYLSPALYGNGD